MKIRWLGQSGYQIQTADAEFLIDPYLSDSVNRVAGRPRLRPIPIEPKSVHCGAVICTHNHLDHLDPDTIKEIPEPQLYITTQEGKEVLEAMGKQEIYVLAQGQAIKIGNAILKAVFAGHTVEAFGLMIEAEGYKLYFSGDTLFDEKLFEIKEEKPDLAFLCINGKLGNMNTSEAVTVAEIIGAKINIPNHYDMFASNAEDPTMFTAKVNNSLIMEFNREYDILEILK